MIRYTAINYGHDPNGEEYSFAGDEESVDSSSSDTNTAGVKSNTQEVAQANVARLGCPAKGPTKMGLTAVVKVLLAEILSAMITFNLQQCHLDKLSVESFWYGIITAVADITAVMLEQDGAIDDGCMLMNTFNPIEGLQHR